MVFAALLLLLPVPQNGGASAVNPTKTEVAIEAPAPEDSAKPADTNKDTSNKDKDSALMASATGLSASAALPAMPVAKVSAAAAASAGDPAPAGAAFPLAPIKPAVIAVHESPTQRKVWYGLAIAGHAGAAFDAWSTRRAISAGAGTEANPMLRPFAHSNALYAATQVSPLVMDFLGKRMMVSQHKWIRKMWWLPQTAGAGISFTAGAHNVRLTQ